MYGISKCGLHYKWFYFRPESVKKEYWVFIVYSDIGRLVTQ